MYFSCLQPPPMTFESFFTVCRSRSGTSLSVSLALPLLETERYQPSSSLWLMNSLSLNTSHRFVSLSSCHVPLSRMHLRSRLSLSSSIFFVGTSFFLWLHFDLADPCIAHVLLYLLHTRLWFLHWPLLTNIHLLFFMVASHSSLILVPPDHLPPGFSLSRPSSLTTLGFPLAVTSLPSSFPPITIGFISYGSMAPLPTSINIGSYFSSMAWWPSIFQSLLLPHATVTKTWSLLNQCLNLIS